MNAHSRRTDGLLGQAEPDLEGARGDGTSVTNSREREQKQRDNPVGLEFLKPQGPRGPMSIIFISILAPQFPVGPRKEGIIFNNLGKNGRYHLPPRSSESEEI